MIGESELLRLDDIRDRIGMQPVKIAFQFLVIESYKRAHLISSPGKHGVLTDCRLHVGDDLRP